MRKKNQNTGAVYSTMVAKPERAVAPSPTSANATAPCAISAVDGVPLPAFQRLSPENNG